MDVFGFTDLHKAIILGNRPVISRLITNHFNKDVKDANGFTATELAILLEKEFLIPYIDGVKHSDIEDEIFSVNELDIEGFHGRLLKRKKLKENYFNLTQNKENTKRNEVKEENSYDTPEEEGVVFSRDRTTTTTTTTTIISDDEGNILISREKNNFDQCSDSGFSTLRSLGDFSFGDFDENLHDDEVFLINRDDLLNTQQWIENKGSSYSDLNHNCLVNIKSSTDAGNGGFTQRNLVIASDARKGIASTFHGHITSINKPQVRSDSCLNESTLDKNNSRYQHDNFFYKYCQSIHQDNELKRSFSWPADTTELNDKKMDDWEVWDFGEKEEKQQDNEEKTSYAEDIFEQSMDDSKGFTASYKLDDSTGNGIQHLHVLSTPNERKTRSISESQALKPDSTEDLRRFGSSCALNQSGKEDKYVFTIQSLPKSRSSTELAKSSDHSDDVKGFSKSFQYEAKKERKGKGFLSFFSKLKRSTSSGELRSSRSRKNSESSDDGRGFSDSVTIDKSSGEEKHMLIVPKMSRSYSSTSVATSSSQDDNGSNDVRGFTRSLNMDVIKSKSNATTKTGFRKTSLGELQNEGNSLRPDSGYFGHPDDHPKKDNIKYSITFTPEESTAKKRTDSPSQKTMTSLQQGLLPLVVGVGLGEEECTQDVINDVLQPHTVQEHGVFALGSPKKLNNPVKNGEANSLMVSPTEENFRNSENFCFPKVDDDADPKHSTPVKAVAPKDKKTQVQPDSLLTSGNGAVEISLNGSKHQTLDHDDQATKTGSDSDQSSSQSEINNIKQIDCDASHLEDSVASFELHEAEYEVGHSPGHATSPFSFNGHRLPDVIEELSPSEEDEMMIRDDTGHDDLTERKITFELLNYMPPIIEQSTEEERESNTIHKKNEDKNTQKVDVVQRVLSTENLRLHDQETDEGKTKDEILNEFVNIVISDADENNTSHADIVDDKPQQAEQTLDLKTHPKVAEENTLQSSKDVDESTIEALDRTLEPSNTKVHTIQSNNTEEEIDKETSENGDGDQDMNRSSHDTFSVEFHVPVESNERIQTDLEVNNHVNHDKRNVPSVSNKNIKKCLWYDYSLDSTPDTEKTETKNVEVANSFIKQEKAEKDRRIRGKKLTRDPSLAWDGLVDVYTEDFDDNEEKLDVIVDFDDPEILREVLPDDCLDNNNDTQDEIQNNIEARLENDEIEAEHADNTEEHTAERTLSNSSYLRLTPDGILSDAEDMFDEDDKDQNNDDIKEIMALVQNLDEHYRKISSDRIIEEINTITAVPSISKNTTDSYVVRSTENIPCASIYINNIPYIAHTSAKEHNSRITEENLIKESFLHDYSYDYNLQDALQDEDSEHPDETLALTKQIYKKREKLRTQKKMDFTIITVDDSTEQNRKKIQNQKTEEFTEISDEEIYKTPKLRNPTQKTESFTILSDSDEPQQNETSASELNLTGVFSDSPISSGSANILSGVMKTFDSNETNYFELKETSSQSEMNTKERHYDNEHEDADSGMDLQSDDLDHSLSTESLLQQQEKGEYDEWLEQIKPTLQDSYRVASLYLRLARNYYNDNGVYNMQQVEMGNLAYWLIVENNLCNFSEVISYILSYMGVLKVENDFNTDVKIDILLNFLSELIRESKMLSNHIEMFTCLLSRPCSQLMSYHDMRLSLLKSCFKEEIRQVQDNGTLDYFTTCFKKISKYFVQIDDNLAEKLVEEYLLPYNIICHSEGFVTCILKYMKFMESNEPIKRTEDPSSSLQLLNILYLKLQMTTESMELLCTYLERSNMKFKLCKKEIAILSSTLKKHLMY